MPTSKLEFALDAARRDLSVFPQTLKRPRIKDWPNNASRDMNVIEKFWKQWPDADIGIALSPDVYVLDADSKAAALAVRGLKLPATLTVRTARGYHWYFRVPHELARCTPGGQLGPIEGKGAPGPVTWAGSVHGSGKVYKITNDAPIARMPGALITSIGPKPKQASRSGEATPAEVAEWALAHRALVQAITPRLLYDETASPIAVDARIDATADLQLAVRALRSELPTMPHGWADRLFRAAAFLGPHVPSGALGLDEIKEKLEMTFRECDTQGEDPEHVLRSIARGAATGARGASL